MEFKSKICTSIEESKRLLELGLKKETADMWHYKDGYGWRCSPYIEIWDEKAYLEFGTPAWSLHRLMEILPFEPCLKDFNTEFQYDAMLIHISNAIESNSINPEYLEKK